MTSDEDVFAAFLDIEPFLTFICGFRSRLVQDGFTDDEARSIVVATIQANAKPGGSND